MKCSSLARLFGVAFVVVIALVLGRADIPWTQLKAVAFMWLQPDSRDAQFAGCVTLHNYAYDNHLGKYWLYNFGALHPLLRAIRRFPDDKDLLFHCANALGGMSLFTTDIVAAAGERGAVEMAVEIMRRWPEDPRMQIGGVHGSFMDLSEVNRGRWSKAGGMEVNVAAIQNHYWDPVVQFQSWCAFSSGTHEPNQERFGAIGGVELSVRVLKDHPESFRVREEVMGSNRAIGLKSSRLRERQVAAGWIEAVALALRDAPLDLHQQSHGCANLATLASENATHRDRAIEAGAVELATEAIRNFPRMRSPLQWEYSPFYTVHYDCIGLLRHLATNSTAMERVVKAEVTTDIVAVMRRQPRNQGVQYEGAMLLKALHGTA